MKSSMTAVISKVKMESLCSEISYIIPIQVSKDIPDNHLVLDVIRKE